MPVRIAVDAKQAEKLADKLINSRSFHEVASRRAGERIALGIQRLLRQVVAGWDTPDKPQAMIQMLFHAGGGFSGSVYIEDKIAYILNVGARRHQIKARNAPLLSFNWGGKGSYVPGTTPRKFTSRARQKNGVPVLFSRVNHPGHKARKWDDEAAKRFEKLAPAIITGELLKEARRQGLLGI